MPKISTQNNLKMIKIVNNIERLSEDLNNLLDINRLENQYVDNIINKIELEIKNINTKIEVTLFIHRDENNKIQFGIDSSDSEITKLIQDVINKCR